MAACRRPNLALSPRLALHWVITAGLCVVMVTPSVRPPITALFLPPWLTGRDGNSWQQVVRAGMMYLWGRGGCFFFFIHAVFCSQTFWLVTRTRSANLFSAGTSFNKFSWSLTPVYPAKNTHDQFHAIHNEKQLWVLEMDEISCEII